MYGKMALKIKSLVFPITSSDSWIRKIDCCRSRSKRRYITFQFFGNVSHSMSLSVNVIDPSRDVEDDFYDIQLFYIKHTISRGRPSGAVQVNGAISVDRLKLAAWLYFKTVSMKSLRKTLVRGY